MEVEVDLATVGHEDAVVHVGEALLFEFGELLEEARDVEDDAGADQVLAVGVDESGGEEMEAVRDAVGNCLVACRVSAMCDGMRMRPEFGRPQAEKGFVCLVGEDVPIE